MAQQWTPRNLRQKARISYYEPEEPDLDQYVFCEKCGDYVYEYCSIHGPLLVIPDDKVPAKPNVPSYVPRAALTIPHVFLHITHSIIPGAGLGVFSSLALPSGVRFGPYRGQRTDVVDSSYCWQIYDKNRKPLHCVDAADGNKSNWMRYVNCARHWGEQNLVAYQYQGELYYRTIKIIPRFTELMVFYGSEFACELDVDLGKYNSPAGYAQKFGAPVNKKRKQNDDNSKTQEENVQETARSEATATNVVPTTNQATALGSTLKDINTESIKGCVNINCVGPEQVENNYEKPAKADNAEAKATPMRKNKQELQNDKVTKITQTKHNKQKENKTSIVKPKTCNIEASENRNNATNDMDNSDSKTKAVTSNIQDFYIFCDDCNKKCASKQELQTHQRFHDPNRAYACEVCSLRYTSLNSLRKHIGLHTKHKTFICEVCNKSFTHLKSHMRIHTGEKPFKCEICDKSFKQIGYLKIHRRVHTGEKPYKCEICDKSFKQIGYLKIHRRVHTGEKPYKCEICDKSFNNISDLKIHRRVHTGEKPYKCEICDKSFNHIGSLKKHRRVHTGEKPYKCEICDKSFNNISDLKIHRRVHTGEKPYKCEICDKSFKQIGYLKIHRRVHTGEKPYKCEICDKSFNHIGSLKKHRRVHTGEKPYKCEICDKSFNNISDLKIHRRVHTGEKPYKCEICDKSFKQIGYLKIHRRVHTGEKPYKCEICDKSFNHIGSLKKHRRVHTGEKPYKCEICDK